MNLIRRVIDIFRFLRKARKQILPDFDELKQEVGLLNGSLDKLGRRVSSSQQDKEEMQMSIKIMEMRFNDFKDILNVQNQLIHVLLVLIEKKK